MANGRKWLVGLLAVEMREFVQLNHGNFMDILAGNCLACWPQSSSGATHEYFVRLAAASEWTLANEEC